MTVFTSQTPLQLPAVTTTPASPTGNPPVRYRVEERTRTIYVTSDVPPAQWNSRNLGTLFPAGSHGAEPVRRTRSKVQTQYIITEETQSPGQLRSAPAVLDRQRSRSSNPPSPLPSSPSRSPRGPRPRILFYHKHDPHYGFTNFSPHNVKYNGKVYPTSEHLFQSFKFQGYRDDLAEHIRLCSPFPSVAFSEARRFPDHVRPDWRQVNIRMMDEAIYPKFIQHKDLMAELLATGDAELVEDSDKDSFWGIGADGKGSNELGKALERLRTRIRKEGR